MKSVRDTDKIDASRLALSVGATELLALSSDLIFKTCPDGTPYTVLKHPENAFKIFGSNWDATIGVTLDKLKGLAGKVGIDIKKRVTTLYDGLDGINGFLAQSFNASYLTYSTRPCDPTSVDALRKSTATLQAATGILIAIKMESSRINPDVNRLEDLQSQLLKVVNPD